ncbi:hypothetical protein TSUD_135200 [Trifolium subterraneum]|uniref:Uncharacterized protein n=1 Tax=Trifolium subterraneum TaxID=3900 RepID=A0A2Z6NHY3_TRISU|nr:hypothetical protein TSUD_135200 [Trifolium subterraneum]
MDADEFMNLLHGSDAVKVELNRLENEGAGGPDDDGDNRWPPWLKPLLKERIWVLQI